MKRVLPRKENKKGLVTALVIVLLVLLYGVIKSSVLYLASN